MDEYGKIKKSILSEVADEIRKAAGLTRELTPVEMIYWLKRIIAIPQGHANYEFTLNFTPSTASGSLPTIYKGVASSEFALNFESNAVCALSE